MTMLSKAASLSEFLCDYLNYKMNRPAFKRVIINITAKCNLDCLFCECCSLDSKNDLTFSEVKKLFSEMAFRGVKSVFIGGGEPFMRKDIWDILNFLKERQYDITIVSNGYILADISEKELSIVNDTISTLFLSLDSTQPHLHNYYRNKKDAFDKVVIAVRRISRLAKTKLILTTIITNDNYKELPDIVEMASAYGARLVCFQPFSDSSNFPEIPPKEKKQFLVASDDIDKLKEMYKSAISKSRELGIETNLKLSEDWIFSYFSNKDRQVPFFHKMVNKFECIIPFSNLYVRHNGDIQLCALLPKISSIRKKQITEVIRDIQNHRKVLKMGKLPPECKRCFCGLSENIRFSILSHPIKNFRYLLYFRIFERLIGLRGKTIV